MSLAGESAMTDKEIEIETEEVVANSCQKLALYFLEQEALGTAFDFQKWVVLTLKHTEENHLAEAKRLRKAM